MKYIIVFCVITGSLYGQTCKIVTFQKNTYEVTSIEECINIARGKIGATEFYSYPNEEKIPWARNIVGEVLVRKVKVRYQSDEINFKGILKN